MSIVVISEIQVTNANNRQIDFQEIHKTFKYRSNKQLKSTSRYKIESWDQKLCNSF